MADIYHDGSYQESNPTWHDEDAPWKARQIEAILRKNSPPMKSVCEVGCGAGGILIELASKFPASEFTGYEISPQAFGMAQRKNSPSVKFHLADLLEQPDAHFDVLLIIDVIEHVEDYIGFVRRLKPLAQTKIFHIPLDLSAQSVTRMWPILNLRQSVGHLHYFTKDTALATLTGCGYKIVDWTYTASRLELPNQALSSQIVSTPRRLLHKINPDLNVRVLGGYSLLVMAQ